MNLLDAKEEMNNGADGLETKPDARKTSVRVRPVKGKTACGVSLLGVELREFVNQSLFKGDSSELILTGLAERNCKIITEDDLEKWKKSGYREWLKVRERIEVIMKQSEIACQLARRLKNEKSSFITANELLLASQIHELLECFDPRVLMESLADKPELYFRLASAVNEQASERTRQKKLRLEFRKYKDQIQEQKQKIEDAVRVAHSSGLSPEILGQIEAAAKLL